MRLLPAGLAAALLTLATTVHAHPGHGGFGPWHWHATDLVGFLGVAVLAGLAFWWWGGE